MFILNLRYYSIHEGTYLLLLFNLLVYLGLSRNVTVAHD